VLAQTTVLVIVLDPTTITVPGNGSSPLHGHNHDHGSVVLFGKALADYLGERLKPRLDFGDLLQGPDPHSAGSRKDLKGLLALHDQPIPHTHNLEELALLCQAKSPELDLARVDVTELMPFAVEMRDDFEF
jgi:hypothetical protein